MSDINITYVNANTDEEEDEKIKDFVSVFGEDYLLGGAYDAECDKLMAQSNLKIGLKPVDDVQSFDPGLYLLAAGTSLGKTTLMGQIADYQAMHGRNVLYYTLEQTPIELFSKSIAREMVTICCDAGGEPYSTTLNLKGNASKSKPCYSARNIRRKYAKDPDVIAAKKSYADKIGNRLEIISSPFNMSAETIGVHAMKRMLNMKGEPPVIIIDYLQILSPDKDGLSDKSKMDEVVKALKKLQVHTGATVLAISSISRGNYLAPLDLSSLKESGGLEYGADVVIGMDLAICSSSYFTDKLKGTGDNNKKRIIYNKVKSKSIKQVRLCFLKNRNGRPGAEFKLYYMSEFDVFTWEGGMSWWDKADIVDKWDEMKAADCEKQVQGQKS